MTCPFCAHDDTKVLDTRADGQGRVRRRRRCAACGEAFVTNEQIAAENLFVKKRDGTVEPFSRSKLIRGIAKAASVYALPPADINAFVDRVVQRLQPTAPGVPIASTEIGRQVLQQMHGSTVVTDIARIRYAMVLLGRTTHAGGFRGLRDFLDWLADTYGSPTFVTTDIRTPSRVKKRNGQVEPFDLTKLEKSVELATKGRGTDREVHELASRIAATAQQELVGQTIVTSQQIGAEVLKQLRRHDSMAYLRYASAVKRYTSVEDFWVDAHGFDMDSASKQGATPPE